MMGAAMAIPSGWGAAAPPRAAAAPPRAAPCVPSRPRDRSLPDREYRYARAAPPPRPARARRGAPGPMTCSTGKCMAELAVPSFESF